MRSILAPHFGLPVKLSAIIEARSFRPVLGAVLTALGGVLLWTMSLGDPWVHASYDYLFRFGSRSVTPRVVFIRMDNDAYDELHQARGEPWDRSLHARLLNRLADDGCELVVMDVFFEAHRDPAIDDALAAAMARQKGIVLMAGLAQLTHPTFDGARPVLPAAPFLEAAGTNHWGVGWVAPDLDGTVRRHWPFRSPWTSAESLPWVAARVSGVELSAQPRERWLRYYSADGPWEELSYRVALDLATNYFRGKTVFIGNFPADSMPGNEADEFRTPYTRWTEVSAAGVEILMTTFLNLSNGDWLERWPWWMEAFLIVAAGAVLGGTLCRLRPLTALATAVVVALAVVLGAVSWSHFYDRWFPWLIIAGGQAPVALVWAVLMPTIRRVHETITVTSSASREGSRTALAGGGPLPDAMPETPDYELVHPPFGEGAYGKVWLARNAVGQWQALKVVYLANFGNDMDPFDREFNGISRYKPVSDKHPGLLRVDFVSRKRSGYFYYVMELGDAVTPGWEREPSTYRPRDLMGERARAPDRRLPLLQCVRIGMELAEALEFLHCQGLTHRDIKPQNILFVNGKPKLADVGLTAQIRPADQERTSVGTPGYMPPPPERPGTVQADIYALGMVLYVLSTGRNASFFPEIATTLVAAPTPASFLPLNSVVLKACDPEPGRRYASAAEMYLALQEVHQGMAESKV